MKRNIIETIVGFIVLAVAGGFIVTAYKSGSLKTNKYNSSYVLYAQFDRADGINIGSDIKLSGIKIGFVQQMGIDNSNYDAIVTMVIDKRYKLPADSSAEIVGNGFLGDKYIAIVPGADKEFLHDGDKMEFSQSSISIESLIGKFMFGSTEKKADK